MVQDDVRLADLLCALSVTLDLAMAPPAEKSIRSCLVATALARRVGLPESTVRDVFYATLLRHLGCTATTHEEAYLYGPDATALRPLAERSDRGNRRESLALFARIGQGTGLRRLTYVGRTVRAGSAGDERILRAICEVGSVLADGLHLGPGVADALSQNLERWDGTGTPNGLAGDQISVATRIAEVATQAVVFDDLGGPEAVSEVLRRRAGGWLDPDLVRAFREDLLAEVAECDVWQ